MSNIHNHLKGDEKGAFPARGVSCGGRLPEDGKLPTPLPGVLRAPPFSPYSHSPHFAEKSKFEHIVEAAVWWVAFDRRGTAEAAVWWVAFDRRGTAEAAVWWVAFDRR